MITEKNCSLIITISFDLDSRPISLPVQSTVDAPKQPTVSDNSKIFQSTTTSTSATADAVKKPLFGTSETLTKQVSTTEQNNDTAAVNDNLTTLITEQRRQNRLLEQVIAAINTTNSLLTQLVQR